MKLNAATRLRARGDVDAHQRTAQEIAALPHFSAASAESAYQLAAGLYVDNERGLGATPDNQNVLYKGFVALLPCHVFADLALHDGDVRRRAEGLLKVMRQGYGIGNPCFYINADAYVERDDPDYAGSHVEIKGHEGRARVAALVMAGIKDVPVQFFPYGYRARHLSADREGFRAFLNAGIVDERGREQTNVFTKPLIFG